MLKVEFEKTIIRSFRCKEFLHTLKPSLLPEAVLLLPLGEVTCVFVWPCHKTLNKGDATFFLMTSCLGSMVFVVGIPHHSIT